MCRQRPIRTHGRRRHRARRATLLTTLALSVSTSGGQAGDSPDNHANVAGSDSAKSNARSGSRYESIDELGDAYFDVSDWTTHEGEMTKTSDQYGIKQGKWTWPYRLSASDVAFLSNDEITYLEQEFGVVMPANKDDDDGHIAENTESLTSDIALENDDFIAPDSFRIAANRRRRRRLTSVDAPTYDERQLRGKQPKSTSEDGVLANRADPRRRRRRSEDLKSNDTGENSDADESDGYQYAMAGDDEQPGQRTDTYRCIDDSPDNLVPCPPDNMGPICDKYNPRGSFRECYEMCKPSFCCVHDSESQNLSPTCAHTEPNCESYFACYIIWWRLSNTIGPATYLRVPQSDEAFYDITYEDVVNDLAADQGFTAQFLGHHFDTDDFPTDGKFEDPANW